MPGPNLPAMPRETLNSSAMHSVPFQTWLHWFHENSFISYILPHVSHKLELTENRDRHIKTYTATSSVFSIMYYKATTCMYITHTHARTHARTHTQTHTHTLLSCTTKTNAKGTSTQPEMELGLDFWPLILTWRTLTLWPHIIRL